MPCNIFNRELGRGLILAGAGGSQEDWVGVVSNPNEAIEDKDAAEGS